MSTGEVFLLVLLASGLSAFTGALGAAAASSLKTFLFRRSVKKAIAREQASAQSGPIVLK